ncbi:hypothetical protein J6590_096687, partial [Homalodisca vitripennis]
MQGEKQWGREVEIYEDSVIGFGSKGTVLGQYLRHVEVWATSQISYYKSSIYIAYAYAYRDMHTHVLS